MDPASGIGSRENLRRNPWKFDAAPNTPGTFGGYSQVNMELRGDKVTPPECGYHLATIWSNPGPIWTCEKLWNLQIYPWTKYGKTALQLCVPAGHCWSLLVQTMYVSWRLAGSFEHWHTGPCEIGCNTNPKVTRYRWFQATKGCLVSSSSSSSTIKYNQ